MAGRQCLFSPKEKSIPAPMINATPRFGVDHPATKVERLSKELVSAESLRRKLLSLCRVLESLGQSTDPQRRTSSSPNHMRPMPDAQNANHCADKVDDRKCIRPIGRIPIVPPIAVPLAFFSGKFQLGAMLFSTISVEMEGQRDLKGHWHRHVECFGGS